MREKIVEIEIPEGWRYTFFIDASSPYPYEVGYEKDEYDRWYYQYNSAEDCRYYLSHFWNQVKIFKKNLVCWMCKKSIFDFSIPAPGREYFIREPDTPHFKISAIALETRNLIFPELIFTFRFGRIKRYLSFYDVGLKTVLTILDRLQEGWVKSICYATDIIIKARMKIGEGK